MAGEWIETTVGEQATLQRGIDITRAEQRVGTVPVVSSGGVSSHHDTPAATGPGVILGRKGVIGSIYYMPSDYWPHDTTLWVKDFHRNDPRFVYYFFRWLAPRIATMDVGSANPTLNRNHVHPIEVRWPRRVVEQRAIAHILGTLDDKIELNRCMNETLEAIAQALFKSWFLDATEDGLPKGWRVSPLPDAIEVNPPRSLRKRETAPYVDMQNMPTQGHRPLAWIDREFGSGMRFINGDTLLARITPCLENGKTAFVDWLEDGQVGWGSTEYIVLHPKPPLPPEYAYYLARSEELRTHAIQNMTGSSGRQRVPSECFAQFEIPVPPEPIARQFGEIAKQLMHFIRVNDEQSRTLAALRDALLPKLISGEIRVRIA